MHIPQGFAPQVYMKHATPSSYQTEQSRGHHRCAVEQSRREIRRGGNWVAMVGWASGGTSVPSPERAGLMDVGFKSRGRPTTQGVDLARQGAARHRGPRAS